MKDRMPKWQENLHTKRAGWTIVDGCGEERQDMDRCDGRYNMLESYHTLNAHKVHGKRKELF
jgi:hypothetical protein